MNRIMMLGATVFCASLAFADVESSNIVGYQNLNTVEGGSKMLVPTFLDVSGSTNGYTLADLSVTGYPDLEEMWPGSGASGFYNGGCSGTSFILRQLTKGGTYEPVEYYWLDCGNPGVGRLGPGWFADSLGTPIEGGAASVKFPANKALWIFGSGYKLIGSGAVNFEEVRYTTVEGGSTAVGNGNPVSIKLSDLTVTGYPDLEEMWPGSGASGFYNGGCSGTSFIIRQLTKGGTYEPVEYYWLDCGNPGVGRLGPGWFADSLGAPIDGGAESVTLEPGQGLWVFGSGYKLIIPGVNLEKK